MGESDELERIRERKREQLLETKTEESNSSQTADSRSAPISVTGAAELENTTQEHSLVLADFYADWCGPCKMMEPILEDIAATTPAAVAKIDVDANQALAAEYQVRGVPTLVLFSEGELVEQITGARDEDTLRTLINRYSE